MFTVETGEYIPIGFSLAAYVHFILFRRSREWKVDKILGDFATFLRKKQLRQIMKKHNAETCFYLCSEKFNGEDRIFRKFRDRCDYIGKYKAATHL